MPDITMCGGEGCSIKGSCYRYTAKPSPYQQAYFAHSPCNITGTTCSYFMSTEVLRGVGKHLRGESNDRS